MIAMTRDEMVNRGMTMAKYRGINTITPDTILNRQSTDYLLGAVTEKDDFSRTNHYVFYSFDMNTFQLYDSIKTHFADLVFWVSDIGKLMASVYLSGQFVYYAIMTKYGLDEYPVLLHLLFPSYVREDLASVGMANLFGSLGRYSGTVETWPFRFGELKEIFDGSGNRVTGKWIPDDLADYFPLLDEVGTDMWLR